MIWVIDASVSVRWLLKDEEHENAKIVLERVISFPEYFAIPELFCFEVFSVLCRLHPSPLKAYLEGMIPIIQGGILRYPMTDDMAQNAYEFIIMGLTGYDACYAALAKDLKGVWLTYDTKAHQLLSNRGISHLLSKKLPADW